MKTVMSASVVSGKLDLCLKIVSRKELGIAEESERRSVNNRKNNKKMEKKTELSKAQISAETLHKMFTRREGY